MVPVILRHQNSTLHFAVKKKTWNQARDTMPFQKLFLWDTHSCVPDPVPLLEAPPDPRLAPQPHTLPKSNFGSELAFLAKPLS